MFTEAAPVTALLFAADGYSLTTLDAAKNAVRWDVKPARPVRLASGAEVSFVPPPPQGILPTAIPAGCANPQIAVSKALAAAGCADGKVHLRPIDPGETPRDIAAHPVAVQSVAFSADGLQLATAAADGVIKVWDTKTGNLLATLVGHTGAVSAVAFSPNGHTIASAGADRTLRFWTTALPPLSDDDLKKIRAAIPAAATAKPKKPRRVLVFWRADGIQHKTGVPAANLTLELLARQTGAFQVEFSRDYDVLDPKVLARFDAIVMNSTAHLAIPDDAKKQALLDYAKGGGGVIGIHASIDTFKDWPAGAEIIGANFAGHPFNPAGTYGIKIDEPAHPLTRAFAGKGFTIHDEIYEMGGPFTRANRRVLLSLDLADPGVAAVVKGIPGKEPVHRADRDFAVAWIKHYGAGRVFYADFGHLANGFESPAIVQFYLDGIQWVLGDIEADDVPVGGAKGER